MTLTPPDAAARLADAFDAYHAEFKGMTRRARGRFARREWREGQRDSAERLSLYRARVEAVEAELRAAAGPAAETPEFWAVARDLYRDLVAARHDAELAETFFNSTVRRLCRIVGVNRSVEFTSGRFEPEEERGGLRVFGGTTADAALFEAVLRSADLGLAWRDLPADAARVTDAVARQLREGPSLGEVRGVDLLPTVFYRNKGAYLVGRFRFARGIRPLVLPIVSTPEGAIIDAVLTTEDEASIVFSFTHSYFHAEVLRPRATIAFLRSIMPRKRLDELYTSIGYDKHGKAELAWALKQHLERSGERFERSEGDRGMVMSVFTLASLNVVFKVIKDRFDHPKSITRDRVKEKYHLVFVRDRVGRLADAQEFEDLEFRKENFAPDLLDELQRVAGNTVSLEGNRVVIRHAYTERRVTPLNLFLRDPAIAGTPAARDAIVDYGNAIRDLAAANIFPGDMLLKNFGVTRHGRVIFYDYDELCLLTECHFRRIPPPPTLDDEFSAEPWYFVGERDVFPEEFRAFVLLPGELGAAFQKEHGDLLDVDFWLRMQERQEAGEMMDFFPYKEGRRLSR